MSPLFRRNEPIHKKLGKALMNAQAGGFLAHPPDPSAEGSLGIPGIHGGPRPRRWDAVTTAEAPRLRGESVHFVALPDRTLVVDEDEPDDSLAPLADAVEEMIEPPYRAEGVRQSETVWAVGANPIEVVELHTPIEGDTIELAVQRKERTLLVDGARSLGRLPELEALAADYDAYVIRAERIDGDLWEAIVAPL